MMYRSVLRKYVIGIIMVLTLIISLVGIVSTHAKPTHAAPKLKFDKHNVLPIHPLPQYAHKLNVSANGVIRDETTGTVPPCLTSIVPPRCYSPQQIRNAYSIAPLLKTGITGKGHTIVLIDFATSRFLRSDVHLYDQLFGLNDPKINVFSPFSTPSVDPGYYTETALDIETVHSIAPDATIDLVLANVDTITSDTQFLPIALKATNYAIQHNLGDVISQSYGVGESCAPSGYVKAEQHVFAAARAKGITILASSGDYGAAVITCSSAGISYELGVNLPASDPLVTSVGGTTLNATLKTGQYAGETVWNEDSNGAGATGGGYSTLFPVPDYQKNILGLANRGIPDVSFDADPLTGVPVVLSQGGATYIIPVGGTSVGSPAWAAIVALLNQKAGHRLGFLNPAVYALSASTSYGRAFHDILLGNNTVNGFDTGGNPIIVYGYYASSGWDPVTGIGTPIVKGLASTLAK